MKTRPLGGGERAAESRRADAAGEAQRVEFLGRAERNLPEDLSAPEVERGQDAPGRRVAGQSQRRDQELRASCHRARRVCGETSLSGNRCFICGVIGGREQRDPMHEVRAVGVDHALAAIDGEAAPVHAAAGEGHDRAFPAGSAG